MDKSKIEAARIEAWYRGYLRYKLRDHQKKVYDQIKSLRGGSFYFNKARRIGGSYLLCVLAIEACLAKEGAQVKYAAPTSKMVRKIITPNIKKILKDCPKEMRPTWDRIEGEWKFPHNDSTLAVAGCDNQQYENLRGTESDFICLDEVGFIDELEYIINDVLKPQTKDTKGLIVLTSTPARSPAHESAKICTAHKEVGLYAHLTVWDDNHYSRAQHEAYFVQMAESMNMTLDEFYASTTFRREYLGEFVADEERSVIPEWNLALEKHITKLDFAVPEYRDRYVSLDIGWRDGMGVLFGYWNYKRAILVIEDELLLFKKTAKEVSEAIRTKEIELWGKEQPFLRISDNNLQTIADINAHGLTFIPTRKDDKELQVNNLREWIRGYKVFIHPRCRRLIAQLGSTIWNKQRTSYERNREGHGDLLDSLVYLVRNVRRDRNPYPGNYGIPTGFDWIVPETSSTSSSKLEKSLMQVYSMEIEDDG